MNARILERAKEIAYSLWNPPTHSSRCFHFSCIVYKGRILLTGTNHSKTHSFNLFNPKIVRGVDVTGSKGICSEIFLILRLQKMTNIPYNKCSLINIRIKKTGEIGLSKPCESCSGALKVIRFNEIVYTDNFGNWIKY